MPAEMKAVEILVLTRVGWVQKRAEQQLMLIWALGNSP